MLKIFAFLFVTSEEIIILTVFCLLVCNLRGVMTVNDNTVSLSQRKPLVEPPLFKV